MFVNVQSVRVGLLNRLYIPPPLLAELPVNVQLVRVGLLDWLYIPPDIANVLNRLRGPFNINQPAMAAGLAALDDQGHIEASRAHNAQWREWLVQQLGGIGFSVRPSFANFILVEFDSDKQASAAEVFLSARGVIPRGLTAYGLPHALRLSIGTEAGNRAALAALTDFIAETDVAEKSG